MIEVSPKKVDSVKYIIITCSGGSGHLQAAASKKNEIKQLEPEIQEIPQYDLLLEWAPLGHLGVDLNNLYAKRGEVKKLDKLAKLQTVAEALYSSSVYVHLVKILKNSDIEHIINTQPLNIKSICKAAHHVNRLNRKEIEKGIKKPIRITVVMTDLPSIYATHFFTSLKDLSPKYKNLITLETTEPALELKDKPNEIAEQSFWKQVLGDLEGLKIAYKPFPIREGFFNKALTDRALVEKRGLYLRVNHVDEEQVFEQLVKKGIAQWRYDEVGKLTGIGMACGQNRRIMSLMLGSTGGVAFFSYIDAVLQRTCLRKENDVQYVFFVFCGSHTKKGDLFDQVVDYLNKHPAMIYAANNILIIPLGKQTDLEIAPIFSRSDTLIFRSGGISSMEVYTIAQEGQQLLIHSEVSGAPENQDWDAYLLNGIFSRERGNAQYLIRKKGASLTNVERFSNMPLVFFEEAHKAIETSDVHLNGLSVMVSKLDLTEGNGAPILHQHQIQSDSSSKDDEVTLEVKKNDSQKGSVPFL